MTEKISKYDTLAEFLKNDDEVRADRIRIAKAQRDAKKDLAINVNQLLISKWR
jgi:hypothetical protein